MTVARSVARCLDRACACSRSSASTGCICNVYVPQLQYAAGLVGYVHRQLGLPIASTAPLARITDGFGAAVHRFARDNGMPWVDFAKGQRKDDVMHEQLAALRPPTEGVVFIGRAQEKTTCSAPRNAATPTVDSYPWIVKTTGLVNHFYFYCLDADFGPFFLKFCSYFPYNAKLCINGHDGPNARPPRPGSGSPRWTTAFAAVDDPAGGAGDLRPARARRRSTPCCASGWPGCRTRSPPRTGPPATATTSRSCRPSSR